jgi:hypothetical protein
MRRLNPCPFCGAKPPATPEFVFDGPQWGGPAPRAIVCDACSAQGPFIVPGTDGELTDTNAKARVAWNSRTR